MRGNLNYKIKYLCSSPIYGVIILNTNCCCLIYTDFFLYWQEPNHF